MLVDTHCHLHDPRFDADRPAAIDRAVRAGVGRFVTVGTDLETSRQAVRLAEEVDSVFATVGAHPHEVKHLRDDSYPELETLAGSDKVIGYGEIGLDLHYRYSPEEIQKDHFRRQIRLARRLRLPIILHTREAFPDTFRILREENAGENGGVFHCFTGDPAAAREALDMGFYISFSGIVTFRNARELQEVGKQVPRDRILVETDSPYLAPLPFRGKRNEPAHVRQVAEFLAQLRGMEPEDLFRQTTKNAERLFRNFGGETCTSP